ncbi:hypothetical protein SAMN02799624_05880 [Paenibacillus sp. UNC496MF]|uniref:hypothetical protein n=1 Tax=Paenibacillus sp. UNC496MF TaxID=1502753 RepID=UPI0008E338A9|nr:hypothetical protein [Paenibacillus sp. UNC496MF]SFJ76862.1 hypothetical protein SAMN02799624_05880 [Paenibacillus sp. UNC496MF]
MKKRNQWLMIGGAAAAVTLFSATAFAYTPNTEGYNSFKEVLKENQLSGKAFESATMNGNFTVTVDGKSVLAADGNAKVADAEDGHIVSSDFDFTIMGVARSGSLYSNGVESIYMVDRTHDLNYQVINIDKENAGKHRVRSHEGDFHDRSMSKEEEVLLDFMVGDLKNNFSVANHADGSKTITADIEEKDIPLPIRLLMDAAESKDRVERKHTEEVPAEWERIKQLPFFQGLEDINLEEQIPELTEDFAIEHVMLQFTVNANNELKSVHGELEVSGKDEAGTAHTVEIEGAGDISGINATTPDMYDPAGKNIEIIDAATFDDRG